MNKISTYFSYMYDYLRNGDISSVYYSIKYVLWKTSHPTDRKIKTSVGTFYCRKGTNDFQFANLYYEWSVKRFILKRIHTFSVFIEAGTCIGEYCIIMAKNDKKCYAFEPVPENFEILEKNVKLNHVQHKIKLLPYGLADENSISGINFNPVNTGASKLIRNRINGHGEVAQIRRLDDIQNQLKVRNEEAVLFKLDIEGMEVEAIEGAAEFIRSKNNISLVVEFKHSGEEKVRESLKKIAKFKIELIDDYNLFARKIGNYEETELFQNITGWNENQIKLFTRHYN